jgi:hypothetical protein
MPETRTRVRRYKWLPFRIALLGAISFKIGLARLTPRRACDAKKEPVKGDHRYQARP